ncbi:c-type cytochrome [Parasulfuritortus cantonensis]|uniref:C-type cytochrome n=1 Tax=Parasulfuritortus cantonensis TaxID=2528202 RepID=A0A4R1BLT4_9PROT|nr:c-type cytochrome [Parasulfuritortus cantonensis]TCJ18401.1 c-type cytochrome [Parasulfuritortus cantonensis]
MADRKSIVTAALLILAAAQAPAFAAGDAGKGQGVFKEQCAECHSVEAGRNRKGPSLFGVLGRAPGSVADYEYSDAMKANAEAWSEARLNDYISHPRRVVPGGKMKYDGLDDAGDRADLIAYLATLH